MGMKDSPYNDGLKRPGSPEVIGVTPTDRGATVTVSGQLVKSTVEHVVRVAEQFAVPRSGDVQLDLSSLEEIDDTGLKGLAKLVGVLRAADSLRVLDPTGRPARVIMESTLPELQGLVSSRSD